MIAAGTLVLLTNSEYGDYGVTSICRATCDIDERQIATDFLAHDESDEDAVIDEPDLDARFLSWLLREGYFVKVPYEEWRINSGLDFFAKARQ